MLRIGLIVIATLSLAACQSEGKTCLNAGFNYKIIVDGQSVQQFCEPNGVPFPCKAVSNNETVCTTH